MNSQPCPEPLPSCASAPGDVDSDDATNVFDVIIATDYITELAEMPEEAFCAADINDNGVIDVGVSATHTKNRTERERAVTVD